MKFLSVIFFISSVLSAVTAVLAFLGVLPGKGNRTGVALVIASGISGLCELLCIWESPVALIFVICSLIIVELIFLVAKNEGADEK